MLRQQVGAKAFKIVSHMPWKAGNSAFVRLGLPRLSPLPDSPDVQKEFVVMKEIPSHKKIPASLNGLNQNGTHVDHVLVINAVQLGLQL